MRLDSRPVVDSLSRHDIIIPETRAQYGSNELGSDRDGMERFANLSKRARNVGSMRLE